MTLHYYPLYTIGADINKYIITRLYYVQNKENENSVRVFTVPKDI